MFGYRGTTAALFVNKTFPLLVYDGFVLGTSKPRGKELSLVCMSNVSLGSVDCLYYIQFFELRVVH